MTKERLSKLQKDILTKLFQNGQNDNCKEVEVVDKKDLKRIRELETKGYKFTNEFLDKKTNQPTGEFRYERIIPTKKLRRSKLLFIINNWLGLNRWTDECGYAGFRGWQKPKDYNKKQVSFTRSIQALMTSRYVDLLTCFEELIDIYNEKIAERLGVEATDDKVEKKKAYLREKETYKKLKITDKYVAKCSFEEYLDLEYQPMFNGMPLGGNTTRRKTLEANHGQKNFRNATWVRLTEKGITKTKELLNVK